MLVQLQKNWPADTPPPSSPVEAEAGLLSIANLLAILRRRALLIGAAVAAMIVVGLLYIVTTKPMFDSTALVYLDIENAQLAGANDQSSSGMPASLSDVDVNSQLQIIRSEKIALSVINQLDIADAEEFRRPPNLIVQLITRGMGVIRSMIRLGPPPAVIQEEGVPRFVVEEFSKRLRVDRVDDTFVIGISYTSENADRAAAVANAVASAFLEEKLDARYESVRRASTWLEGRLSELREKAVASDQLVQQYKRQNGIIDTNSGGQLLSDTQLTELSTRLVEAQKETATRRARYDQIAQMIASGNPDASVVDSLSSPVISQLRAQYSRIAQQEADIARRYGAEHDAAKRARSQMEDINGLILRELGRIEQVYKSDLEVAIKQEADLAQQMEGFTARSTDIAEARVRLRELERNAEADQNLYESFLDRYKSALQQQSFPITDARVLTEASPARKKSSPKTVITLALSTVAGLALGLLLALGRELADRTFRTPGQIEQVLGVPCLGILPKLGRGQARRALHTARKEGTSTRLLSRDLGVLQHVVKAPLSRFAETLRSVKLALDFAPGDGGMRVIGVVSSMPGEGKSTVSMNIAQLIASSGNSVLVIDADLRSPTLTREVTPDAEAGLFEFLVNNVPINDLIYSDEAKRLKFLPAAGKDGAEQKTDLIGSGKMAQLLTAARQTYNYVIVDLPPLAPVIDAKAVAGSVDGFVFVVEWGETSIATVSDALHNAPHVNQKIIGCVLNKADENTLRLYTASIGNSSYYHHEKFGSYVSQG
ncbi:MAG: polysaccharide biosynthesis tyrosine autokinase [Mesorhizobium sp.]|nr:polysaccharide biosynthesis tyrosine autokinase [Mesorhizobium sp.]MBL8580509.1 polysaccharide biosynthesis tyrosine autokinase [Mesorhizobium sp.]